MAEITDPKAVDEALFEYHTTLAAFMLDKLENKSINRILEIGPGPGTFTIPFLRELNYDFEILYCVDPYPGPYKGDRKLLEEKIAAHRLKAKVEVLERDVREIDEILSDIDLVIGHEVLCDLTATQAEEVLVNCHRVLKAGGVFLHSELSPGAKNRGEELVHIMNDYSEEPISDTNWFSPTAAELESSANRVGFSEIKVEEFKIPLKLKGPAVVELVKRWKIKTEFLEKYRDEIANSGIEFPSEQVFICTKL
ncbi:class I SAM-dependent methyltransferase [[Eubacterium] cellulosolvens]